MTHEQIIVSQARELAEARNKNSELERSVERVAAILFSIGGPLNDSPHKYSTAQLQDFLLIADAINKGT